MNCQEFWDNLPRRGDDIAEEQVRHLAACARCAAQWEPLRSLAAGLHSMAEEWRTVQAPPRVEAGLMAAFRAHGAGAPGSRGSWWTPVFAWAGAAAAMMALAAVLIRGYSPAPAQPGTVAAPRHTARQIVQVAAAPGDADSDDDASVLGDGFIRLPNAPRIEANEDFNVVRVEVPGSAMIAMGVSVGEERASQTVVADVALGPDGTARAVRLVSDDGTL
jgi:hypothetical protein